MSVVPGSNSYGFTGFGFCFSESATKLVTEKIFPIVQKSSFDEFLQGIEFKDFLKKIHKGKKNYQYRYQS